MRSYSHELPNSIAKFISWRSLIYINLREDCKHHEVDEAEVLIERDKLNIHYTPQKGHKLTLELRP